VNGCSVVVNAYLLVAVECDLLAHSITSNVLSVTFVQEVFLLHEGEDLGDVGTGAIVVVDHSTDLQRSVFGCLLSSLVSLVDHLLALGEREVEDSGHECEVFLSVASEVVGFAIINGDDIVTHQGRAVVELDLGFAVTVPAVTQGLSCRLSASQLRDEVVSIAAHRSELVSCVLVVIIVVVEVALRDLLDQLVVAMSLVGVAERLDRGQLSGSDCSCRAITRREVDPFSDG